MPGAEAQPGADLAALESRLATFRDGIATALAGLEPLLPKPTEEQPRPIGEADLGRIRNALLVLASYGTGAPPTRGYSEVGLARLHEDARGPRGMRQRRVSTPMPRSP